MPRVRRQVLDVAQLTKILADDQACQHLRCYFGVGVGVGVGFGSGEVSPYTGGRFEFLDGGGDRAGICSRFTAADIVALGLLSIDLPGRVALDLLEGALGDEAAAFLEQIPASVNLWDEEAADLIGKGVHSQGAGLASDDGGEWR